jgi:hypothetical protein
VLAFLQSTLYADRNEPNLTRLFPHYYLLLSYTAVQREPEEIAAELSARNGFPSNCGSCNRCSRTDSFEGPRVVKASDVDWEDCVAVNSCSSAVNSCRNSRDVDTEVAFHHSSGERGAGSSCSPSKMQQYV